MPVFIPLICLVAMGLALFRRSIRFPQPARRCARTWFSLDQGDNDPALFWTYLAAALNTAAPRGYTGAPWLLQPPSRRDQAGLVALPNDLGAISDDVVLVLDDYHIIDARDVQDGMGFLLDHLPPADTPGNRQPRGSAAAAGRLRGRGELAEIRAADLRFTPGEATAYLNEVMGLALTAADIPTSAAAENSVDVDNSLS